VAVASVYAPPDLAVHFPVTCKDAVTVPLVQAKPAFLLGSNGPDVVRHDEVTFQVPSTSPPQGVTLVHEPPAPPLPVLPPLAVDPPLAVLPPLAVDPPLAVLPPEPVRPPLLVLPPLETVPPLPDDPPDWGGLPPLPGEVVEPPPPHAPRIIPNAIGIARTADWSFIERLLPNRELLSQ
jgi:hypothetical protein